jgi:formylglycine-generating enzyme required for sulfatase activity
MNARAMALAGLAAILLAGGTGMAGITIETVPVGDPGNVADMRYNLDQRPEGYGAVAYTYNIGKYEVTAGQYTAFLNAVGGVDTYRLYNTTMANTICGSGITRNGGGTGDNPYTYTVATAYANRPVDLVGWGDAVRFANWLTNGQPTGTQGPLTTEDGAYHLAGAVATLMAVVVPSAAQRATWSSGAKPYFLLTSEDEWYKAAYYKGGGTNAGYWDYPTRSNTPPGQDMTEATNPGDNANYYTAPYVFPIDSGKSTTVAGEFQLSDSPYGTFDQGGNVWEWNEASVSGSNRGWRGGSYASNGSNYLDASYRNGDYPTYEYLDVGFRISEVPEPATMAVLVLGSIGFLLRRRGLRR